MNNPFIFAEHNDGNVSMRLDDLLFNERRLFLTEEVNTYTASELIKQFMYLDRVTPDREITFYIASPGGDVTSGLCLYDVIRGTRSSVTTVCCGLAASMGAILWLAGDKREIYEDGRIMIHGPSTCFGAGSANLERVRSTMDDLEMLKERLDSIVADRSGHRLSEITELTRGDTYFNAEQAKKFGLATHIIRFDRTGGKTHG